MINKLESADRELNLRCKILYDMTKEMVENHTKANKRLFNWAYHETWMLKSFPKCLASKKAYTIFFDKFNDDIRKHDWFSRTIQKCRDGNNKRLFMHEHLTTSEDFKQELIFLYKNNLLSIEKIKQLISQQRVCWITREEDDKLSEMGYRKHRPDPLGAYAECGIEIYEAEKEDLSNIMKPSTTKIDYNSPQSNTTMETKTFFYKPTNPSILLMEKIKTKILADFPDFNAHYSMSYIQIWKKTWNNQGKRGIHLELTPQQSKGFECISEKEKFIITFKLHNEINTQNILPQVPKSKTYFKKEYCFLKENEDRSLNQLLKDLHNVVEMDEHLIDNAHKTL